MRVLDIDLDLFLEDTCPLAPIGERPCLDGHRPWETAEVERFLEQSCGLDKAHPIPGAVFDTHDKALYYWQSLIAGGRLSVPFSVTHADAHSDLGIGYPGTAPVLSGVLPVRFPERTDVSRYLARKQLDEANYLLYALAFRYIDALDNVRNVRSKADFPGELAAGSGDAIRLDSFAARLFESVNGPEPVIPYRVYTDPFSFRAEGPYDFMTLAISPRYSPAEADALVPVISAYMCPCTAFSV